MRKRLVSLLMLVLLFAGLSCTAFADSSLPYVTDMAGLLNSSEIQALEDTATAIAQEYNCGLYIIVLDDFRKYSTQTDAYAAAQEIYTQYNLGYGSERTGMLLLLSMAERDFAVAAYGTNAHIAFTDYGKEVIIDSFLPELGNNYWYAGFADYLNTSASLLKSAAEGNPVDVVNTKQELGIGAKIAIVLLVPALIALAVCSVFKAQMKTAHIQNQATEYVDSKSFNLYSHQDVFMRRSVTRVPIPKSEPSSGGTTVNSSGFSGRSGKF